MADGPLPVEGVDYTGGANISALVAAGKVFACRYGGPGGSWKHLTVAEAQSLSAAGIAVVANAEGSADGLLGGWSTGFEWASEAEEHFARCGMPGGRPIYFSVDFDVTTSTQWDAVASALRGAAKALGGVHRVGVYGGRRAIEWARRDDVARWFWQAYAWSGGYWVPGNHIEQYRNKVSLAGTALDLDRAYGNDFGQWFVNGEEDDMSEWSEADPYGPDPDGHNRTPAQKQRDDHAALFYGTRPLTADGKPVGPEPWIVTRVNGIEAKLDALTVPPPAPVDVAALVAALRPELDAAAERAVRKVLGGLDGATPA